MFGEIFSLGSCRLARLFIGLVLLALIAGGRIAYAHAALVSAAPTDGVVLTAVPSQAVLTFDEPVSPLVFRLVLPDGTALALDRVQTVDNELRIDLPGQRQPGTYALSWRVISADGHPVGGAVVFSLGVASAAPAIAPEATPFLRQSVIWMARLALYIGLFFGVGGALFLACSPPGAGGAIRYARLAIGLGVIAIPVSLALQGLDALNAPWGALAGAQVWLTALDTTYSITLALALLALAAAWVALTGAGLGRIRMGAIAGVVLLGAAFAASGHASVASPQWLARPAVWLHTVAVAAWLGSLIPLLYLARNNGVQLVPVLRRFSYHIRWVVAIFLVSGLLLVVLQLDHVTSLWRTTYGQILLCKLALVAVLLLLAAWNRYRLTAGVLANQNAARRVLGRIIAVEIALALCVLAVVALWRFTPPPRSLHSTAPVAVSAHLHSASAFANIVFTPAADSAQSGTLQLTLTNAKSAPLLPVAVDVSFLNAASGIEPLLRKATQLGPGHWEVRSLRLPNLPHWTVRLDIFISDFDRIQLEGDLAMPPPMAGNHHMPAMQK